jgi:hypothetical protein
MASYDNMQPITRESTCALQSIFSQYCQTPAKDNLNGSETVPALKAEERHLSKSISSSSSCSRSKKRKIYYNEMPGPQNTGAGDKAHKPSSGKPAGKSSQATKPHRSRSASPKPTKGVNSSSSRSVFCKDKSKSTPTQKNKETRQKYSSDDEEYSSEVENLSSQSESASDSSEESSPKKLKTTSQNSPNAKNNRQTTTTSLGGFEPPSAQLHEEETVHNNSSHFVSDAQVDMSDLCPSSATPLNIPLGSSRSGPAESATSFSGYRSSVDSIQPTLLISQGAAGVSGPVAGGAHSSRCVEPHTRANQ